MDTSSQKEEQTMVNVRRHKGDYRCGSVSLTCLRNPHWSLISGGAQVYKRTWDLYAYIWCDDIVEGEVAHRCSHGEGPHNIKVIIQKCDNKPKVYKVLADEAGSKPVKVVSITTL